MRCPVSSWLVSCPECGKSNTRRRSTYIFRTNALIKYHWVYEQGPNKTKHMLPAFEAQILVCDNKLVIWKPCRISLCRILSCASLSAISISIFTFIYPYCYSLYIFHLCWKFKAWEKKKIVSVPMHDNNNNLFYFFFIIYCIFHILYCIQQIHTKTHTLTQILTYHTKPIFCLFCQMIFTFLIFLNYHKRSPQQWKER